MTPRGRPWPAALAAVLGVLLLLVVTACAPRTPDQAEWRAHAVLAASDVRSGVQVARVALQQSADDHIFDSYLQVVAVDAEGTAGSAADTFAGFQPPRAERQRYDAVTGQLDAAAGLLSEVRIAVVAGNEGQYADLAVELHDAARSLEQLELDLRHPPEEPAGPAS